MFRNTLLAVGLLAASAAAQTFTTCNPLNSTCPADPALGTTFNTTFDASMSEFDPRFWNVTNGASLISFGQNGANLPLSKGTDAITVQSNFFIMFGQFEIIMRAAPGQGIISTAILISDDLDEIDWEIMGGNSSYVENNWYGWGNQSQRNAEYEPLDGAQTAFHNYTIDWTAERIQLLIDSQVRRTIPYNKPSEYPQTPMQVRFGIWAAGASSAPGTVEWAGGPCDFSKGPFAMNIKSIRITDAQSGVQSYTYGDHSGNFNSISALAGNSTAYVAMHTLTSAQRAQQQWDSLSTGAKIGIGCGVGAVFLIGFVVFAVYFAGQRKQGRLEREKADKEWQQQTDELAEYRKMMAKGQFAVQHMGHGEKF